MREGKKRGKSCVETMTTNCTKVRKDREREREIETEEMREGMCERGRDREGASQARDACIRTLHDDAAATLGRRSWRKKGRCQS